MSGVAVFQGGLFSGASTYTETLEGLNARGIPTFGSGLGGGGFDTLAQDAELLSTNVRAASRWATAHGRDPGVTLYLYSKGGAAGLKFLNDGMPGAELVRRVVLIASPVNGSQPVGPGLSSFLARHLPISPVRELVPESAEMRRIQEFVRSGARGIPMHSIVSDWGMPWAEGSDGFIKAREGALPNLPNFTTELVRGENHIGIVADPHVLDRAAAFGSA